MKPTKQPQNRSLLITLAIALLALSACGHIPVKTGMTDPKINTAKQDMRQNGAILVMQPCIKANVFGDNYILQHETFNAAKYLDNAVTRYMATEGIQVKKTIISGVCGLSAGSKALVAKKRKAEPRTISAKELYGEENYDSMQFIPMTRAIDCMRGTIGAWSSECKEPLSEDQAKELMALAGGARHLIYIQLGGRINSTCTSQEHR